LNYFVNYTNSSVTRASAGYLYNPATNTATTDSHYLNAGIYVVDVRMTYSENNGPTTSTFAYTMGVFYSTFVGTLNTAGQAGTTPLTSISYLPTLLAKNGVFLTLSYTGCFTLPSANYVNMFIQTTGTISGGNVIQNLNGCIRRIG
jgi:hypothetical protein